MSTSERPPSPEEFAEAFDRTLGHLGNLFNFIRFHPNVPGHILRVAAGQAGYSPEAFGWVWWVILISGRAEEDREKLCLGARRN